MKISIQGQGHYENGINNQDFFYCKEGEDLKMILDGCSQAKYSEIGTRLFVQLFSLLPDKNNPEYFEDNLKKIFNDLVERFKFFYPTDEALEEFISENLLFTIIARFETDTSFIVKMFGDGYIITVNNQEKVSYLRYYYGRRPPYYVYKYCNNFKEIFKDYGIKTYIFDKKYFKKVGIASDGIVPIARGDLKQNFDKLLTSPINSEYSAAGIISSNGNLFFDDVTLLI